MNYSYHYAFDDGTTAAIIFGIISTFLLVFIVLGLVYYIFSSLGYYTMAKNKGVDNAWLAWIPIGRNYIMGRLVNNVVPMGSIMLPNAQIFLMIMPVASAVLAAVPVLGVILSLVTAVYFYLALYRLYKLYNADKAVLFIVLSIIFAITIPFFIFSMRNREPVEYLD